MLICRSQGHLLFSDWTISQRTVSVQVEACFRSCSVFQRHLENFRSLDWDGKSSASIDICKTLLKNFFNPCSNLLALPFPPALQRTFFRKRLQM